MRLSYLAVNYKTNEQKIQSYPSFAIIVILFYFLFVRTNTTYNSDTKCIKETIKLDLFQYNQKILIKNLNKYTYF
jgi:hypothetical protein